MQNILSVGISGNLVIFTSIFFPHPTAPQQLHLSPPFSEDEVTHVDYCYSMGIANNAPPEPLKLA
jgi:hypothetical protein